MQFHRPFALRKAHRGVCASDGGSSQIAEQRRRSAIDERDSRHRLPDGTKLEVLSSIPMEATGKLPLVFIHGAAHGAWCWRVIEALSHL